MSAALPTPPQELIAFLQGLDQILITSHANPDGDAIGSESGLARVLQALGKRVCIWNHDPAPAKYANWLEGLPLHVGPTPPDSFPQCFDAVFFVECPTIARTGHQQTFDELPKINVDHHLGNDFYGLHDWVLPEMASVSIMIFQIGRALEANIDEVAADSLLLGLVTDTGGFRFSNTTAKAHQAAAALVEAGASPERVSKGLYESQPEASLRLLGAVLETLQRHHDGAIATILMTEEMLARTGATRADGESLIDYPRSIAGVEVAVLLRELGANAYKASLRSRGKVSVEAVARKHGGGGHRNAAGCELTGDLESVLEALVTDLAAELSKAAAVGCSTAEA